MKRTTQQFIASFAITCTFIMAICGFTLVDIGAQRYLPSSQIGALFLIKSISKDGIRFTAAGEDYIIAAAQFDLAGDFLWEHRGLIPTPITFVTDMTAFIQEQVEQWQEKNSEPEEIW